MDQTRQQLGIDRLSVGDRLELIGQIWENIAEAQVGFVPPDWHLQELERRRASAEADPEAGIPWEAGPERVS